MIDNLNGGNQEEHANQGGGNSEVPADTGTERHTNNETDNPAEATRSPEDGLEPAYEWIVSTAWPKFRLTVSSPNFWIAIATVVIAGATIAYTHYARRQWTAMEGQLLEMQKQTLLTRQQLVGTQGAVLKDSETVSAQGFGMSLINIHEIPAVKTHISVRLTLISLPKGQPLNGPVLYETEEPLIAKDKEFRRYWPVPWPQREFRENDWPGTRAVKAEGEYTYGDGLGGMANESFCIVYLPRLHIASKDESISIETPVKCERLETTIRDVQFRMNEANQEKRPN